MKKPLKQSVGTDWKHTVKLIPALRCSISFFFFFGFGSGFSCWNCFADLSFHISNLLFNNSCGCTQPFGFFLVSELPQQAFSRTWIFIIFSLCL